MNTQGNLRINRAERRFLGVCAGLADYLDVPVVLVRIIFIISVLTWPTLIVGYFVLYFCLDNNITTQKVQEFFSGSGSEHFRKLDYRRPIYRNMHNKRVAGVCSGVADYLEVSTFWVRAAAIGMLFIFGPYALLAYVISWFVMEPNVVVPRGDWSARKQARRATREARRAEKHQRRAARHMRRAEKYIHSGRLSDDYKQKQEPDAAPAYAVDVDAVSSASAKTFTTSIEECTRIYYQMETRMRQIEAFITSKRFRLHCEINRA